MERSDAISLSAAAAGHVLLIGALSVGLFTSDPPRTPPPDSIEVTFADSVALESASPLPRMPTASEAPDLGPPEDAAPATVAEPEPAPQPTPAPKPAPAPKPEPKPKAEPKPTPAPKAQPAPKPKPKAEPKAEAKPKPVVKETARPARDAPKSAAKASDTKAAVKTASAETGNGKAQAPRASRLGPNFLAGVASDQGAAAKSGTNAITDAQARALNQDISRQLKPHWRAPTGADADQLVTTLRWTLNRDGSIASGPDLVAQTGKTASNAPQQQLHVEAAIKAVKAAAPFKLPADYYDYWKNVAAFRFDRRL